VDAASRLPTLAAHDPHDVTPTGAPAPYDAVIFDLDGVVADTAGVRAAAWADLFDAALRDPRAGTPAGVEPFDRARGSSSVRRRPRPRGARRRVPRGPPPTARVCSPAPST
jgi:hypothetical protein